MTDLIENSRIWLDEQGAGRNVLAEYAARDAKIPGTDLGVGLRKPDSGRTTIHPAVAKIIETKYKAQTHDRPIHLISPDHITSDTVVIALLHSTADFPPYIFQAREILLAPTVDPFDDLEKSLPIIATQIHLWIWLIEYILKNNSSEIGKHKDEHNLAIPRSARSLAPSWLNQDPEHDPSLPYHVWYKSFQSNNLQSTYWNS